MWYLMCPFFSFILSLASLYFTTLPKGLSPVLLITRSPPLAIAFCVRMAAGSPMNNHFRCLPKMHVLDFLCLPQQGYPAKGCRLWQRQNQMNCCQEKHNPQYSAPSRNIPSLASTLSDILVLWSLCIHPHTAFIQHVRKKSAPLLCAAQYILVSLEPLKLPLRSWLS